MEETEAKTKDQSSSQCSHTDCIPFDLTREILMRLPAESLMRFRCVSKLWASVTSDPHFITTKSRSCLLLNFQRNDNQLFLRLSQHKNLELSLRNVEKYPLTLPKDRYGPQFQFQSVHGLISFHYLDHTVIWNPSIGQHVTFQKPNKSNDRKSYLGYDPIENTYKLLSMSCCYTDDTHVLTLGAQESWRPIKDIPKRFLAVKGICINGVLYIGMIRRPLSAVKEIMSFDVRTEKFILIRTHSCMHDDMKTDLSLVNYKGRLAWVILELFCYKLWVLEDAQKELWSCQDFYLPISPYDPISNVDYFLSNRVNDAKGDKTKALHNC